MRKIADERERDRCREVTIANLANPTPRAMPTMRFVRVGNTVEVFVNGDKVNILTVDEVASILDVLGLRVTKSEPWKSEGSE